MGGKASNRTSSGTGGDGRGVAGGTPVAGAPAPGGGRGWVRAAGAPVREVDVVFEAVEACERCEPGTAESPYCRDCGLQVEPEPRAGTRPSGSHPGGRRAAGSRTRRHRPDAQQRARLLGLVKRLLARPRTGERDRRLGLLRRVLRRWRRR